MKKGWTNIKLITVGGLGALSLILTLPASSLALLTGIPLMGGFINIFFDRTMDAIALLIVPKFGSVTIKRTVFGILAIPTLILGPSGFLPKVLISTTSGLIIDLAYKFSKGNQLWRISLSLVLGVIYCPFALVYMGRLLSVPGIDETARIFLSPLVLFGTGVAGVICGCFGWLIYQKIRFSSLIQRFKL